MRVLLLGWVFVSVEGEEIWGFKIRKSTGLNCAFQNDYLLRQPVRTLCLD